ncbi:jg4695 [Pararge aegeria aegeria]|uniref:Jg4695 protein n=1 Tax=Pararge aegeria aegeria TaxID=348720 RepID=A0A8S4RG46_9NEOP|nr:jg4695 [Pararge aegeria aegeria]
MLYCNISNEVQFRARLEGQAKLASKKLGVLNRANRYLRQSKDSSSIKQVRPHMEYCSHLWVPLYQLLPFDRIQKRAVRLVDNPKLTFSFESLRRRRDASSLCLFYRLYNRECSEELFALIPPSMFS